MSLGRLQRKTLAGEHTTSTELSSGSITVCEGKVHKRISSVYKSRRDYQDHSNYSFHCLIPCSIALHLFLVRLLSNTRLYKAIGACTIVYMYGTDLQRGRAVTSMFRDVTIETYARFQSLSLLSMMERTASRAMAETTGKRFEANAWMESYRRS